MGFSILGLVVAVAVLAPNLLLVWAPPRDGFPSARVPLSLNAVERFGQALCLVVPAVTEPGPVRWAWAVAIAAGLAGYYLLWARYLLSGRAGASLYAPVGRIPVPMAILPVVIFFSAGAWLANLWVIAAAVVLAVGHIPASLIIARRGT